MKIVTARPPNYDKIFAEIPTIVCYPNAVFCYGDTIYNPSGTELPPWIIAHEEVHSIRQGDLVDKWWTIYLTSRQFRFDEEVPAYRAQWREFCKHVKDRNQRARYLLAIAQELASEIYGRKAAVNRAQALIQYGN